MAHITVKDEPATPGPSIVKDLFLVYGTDEKMALAIWEEWQHDPNNPADPNNPTWPWPANFYPNPNDPNNTHKVAAAATEFRYESGRRRHLLRFWNTGGHTRADHWTSGETLWTDYPGNEPYVDYTVANVGGAPVATDVTRFLAGLGIHGREGLGEGGEIPRFIHGDLIGSTMMETGPTGEVASSGGWEDSRLWQYTAFGEPIWPWPEVGIQRTVSSGRYKYAGSYGYEWGMIHLWGANEDLPPILLLHVGERWYQPGTGRFVQRDPIELDGGVNVYAYVGGSPTWTVDPEGFQSVPVGDPSPVNPTPYPRPPRGRIRIKWNPAPKKPPTVWQKCVIGLKGLLRIGPKPVWFLGPFIVPPEIPVREEMERKWRELIGGGDPVWL